MFEAVKTQPQDTINPAVPFVPGTARENPALSRTTAPVPAIATVEITGWAISWVKPDVIHESPEQTELSSLLRQISKGNQAAFEKFYGLTTDRVFSIAHQILASPEDAEEVVSNTFWQVWRSATHYCGDKSTVLGWLTMITRSRALDMRRRHQRKIDTAWDTEQIEGHESTLVIDDLEYNYHSYQTGMGIRAMLADLPAMQQRLLELAYHHDYSHREIAEITGLPLGTVKSHLRRTLIRLRKRMAA